MVVASLVVITPCVVVPDDVEVGDAVGVVAIVPLAVIGAKVVISVTMEVEAGDLVANVAVGKVDLVMASLIVVGGMCAKGTVVGVGGEV